MFVANIRRKYRAWELIRNEVVESKSAFHPSSSSSSSTLHIQQRQRRGNRISYIHVCIITSYHNICRLNFDFKWIEDGAASNPLVKLFRERRPFISFIFRIVYVCSLVFVSAYPLSAPGLLIYVFRPALSYFYTSHPFNFNNNNKDIWFAVSMRWRKVMGLLHMNLLQLFLFPYHTMVF